MRKDFLELRESRRDRPKKRGIRPPQRFCSFSLQVATMTPEDLEAGEVRFEPFTLDRNHGELRKEGRPVKMHPQPAQLLVLLVRRAGEIVTREEIQKALWEDETFVDFDLGINSCIRQIRTALGDDAEKPRYLEKVPRKGYRFIAPLDEEPAFSPDGVQLAFVKRGTSP